MVHTGEELGKGSMDKYKALQIIHKILKPKQYLEIGVQKGKSLALANCISVGVDPAPRISFESNATIFKMKSDDFFKENKFQPDLAFIDGMHLFENVLMDFINTEKNSHRDTIILIDDIFPAHPAQALRERRTKKWCGDVWKIIFALINYRPDLDLHFLDVYPTGMLLIKNLNPSNTYVFDDYSVDNICNDIPPDHVICREGVSILSEDVLERILNA